MNNLSKASYLPLLVVARLLTCGCFGSSVDPIKAGEEAGVLVMHGEGA